MRQTSLRLGLLLNPMAGIGGAVGLKGSDGPEIQALAKQRLGQPQAAQRTQIFLQQMKALLGSQIENIQWLTWADDMGADVLMNEGLAALVLGHGTVPSCGEDSQVAAKTISAEGVDLLSACNCSNTAIWLLSDSIAKPTETLLALLVSPASKELMLSNCL